MTEDNQPSSRKSRLTAADAAFANPAFENKLIDFKTPGTLDGIRECADKLEVFLAFSLIQQLRPWLQTADQWGTIFQRQNDAGYRLMLAFRDGVPRALAGFRIQENLIHRKFLYVDDLVSDSNMRSAGLGTQLIEELERVARHAGCETLVLDTAIANHDAQRFYERCGMRALATRYVLPIEPLNERA